MLIGWLAPKSEALKLTKKGKFPISSDSGLSKNKLPDVSKQHSPMKRKEFYTPKFEVGSGTATSLSMTIINQIK